MKKVAKLVLMLCLILSGAFSYAHGVARTENEKDAGLPLITIQKAKHGGTDRSGSIVSTLDDHVLTVVFTENLGQVSIEVTTVSGAPVEGTSTITPTGIQIDLPNTGDYIVTFTRPMGTSTMGSLR